MAIHPTATLIAEVGNAITKLVLVDLVDGDFRLVARAEAASTLAAPAADLTVAILRLASTLETITGRELVRNGRLLVPGDAEGNGAGALVVTTSAAGVAPVIVAALAAQQSARAAVNAARGTYTRIERVFALDSPGSTDERWLGREIAALAATRPEHIIIAGGLEGGAVSALERLGAVVGLLARRLRPSPRVIYAGNSIAAEAVRAALGDGVDMEVVGNLRPTATHSRLEPTRSTLQAAYRDRYVAELPGYATLQAWRVGHVGLVAEDQAVMLRFLAERFDRNILALDVGARHSSAQMQADGQFSQAIMTDTGLAAGGLHLLDAVGAGAITRWLPYELSAGDLQNRLLNRLLNPGLPPVDLDELLLDQALIRAALGLAIGALAEARPAIRYDLVVAGGAVARAPRPGLAALSLLDTLPLDDDTNHFAIDLYLDSLHLLAAGGALAHVDVDAAACLVERDGLNNGPLATLILPRGTIQAGKRVVEVELKPLEGEAKQIEVRGGEIARIELPRGQRGTLRIRPAGGIYIGGNAPGTEVLSDEAAIAGSALGVLIDARPRPLRLPDQPEERARTLLAWLKALDALPSLDPPPPAVAWPSPVGQAADAAPSPTSEIEVSASNTSESVQGDVSEAAPEAAPGVMGDAVEQAAEALPVASVVDVDTEAAPPDDLQTMRDNLIAPVRRRRGFFRRR